MSYASDREFTDYVHKTLALREIYPKMDWIVQEVNHRMGKNIDINNAVDYMAVDSQRKLITIQERFREVKYSQYSDFTFRYKRPENIHEERQLSEFFKLDADFFIYGIIDVSKNNFEKAQRFVKYAVIDLKCLMTRVDDGTIVINENLHSIRCSRMGNTMHCPVNSNRDHSSTFVPFDIIILGKIAPEVIQYQEGFL